MRLTLLLPGSLVSPEYAPAIIDAASGIVEAAPALFARIARAELAQDHEVAAFARGAAHLDWLASNVFHSQAPATAPYALAALSAATEAGQVWHADPIHLQLAGDHLIVQRIEVEDREAEALLAVANESAAGAACRLTRHHSHWFLLTEQPWSINAAPLDAAEGGSLAECLPSGADASRWSRLLNEIQISWHAHPVNEQREECGKPQINSLWLHGGGAWQSLSPIEFAQVNAESPALRGAAQASGAAVGKPDAPPVDRSLLVWTDALTVRAPDAADAWLAAMSAIDRRCTTLGEGHLIDFVLAGRRRWRRFRARPSDRLRPWRRHSIRAVFAE
jgi:hypothetical protein